MRVRLGKKGIRVLGVAESFRREYEWAVLAGVVMRSDLVIDGVVMGRCRVGGMDATDSVIGMVRRLGREDISAIMLNGCIISWFNIIDLDRLYKETGLPVICVSYYPSEGIRHYIERYFPEDWRMRVEAYERLGERREYVNRNGFRVYLRWIGVEEDEAEGLVDRYTMFGRIPEPLRVAKLVAHAALMDRLLHQ